MKSRDRFRLMRTAAAIVLLATLVFALAGHHHPLFASHGSGERMASGTGIVDCFACTLERSASVALHIEPLQVDLDSAAIHLTRSLPFVSPVCDALASRAPPLA